MRKYLPVFISALVLYLAGVLSGFVIFHVQYGEEMRKIETLEKELAFLTSVSEEESLCSLSRALLANFLKKLEPFWKKAPERVETARLTPFLEQYFLLELKAWGVHSRIWRICHSVKIPVLYFCTTDLSVGRELDKLDRNRFFVYTIKSDWEPAKEILKNMGIEPPVVIACGKVLSGEIKAVDIETSCSPFP